jgi:hypothetical protein
MSGLLDFITGGENDKAQEALSQALAQMQAVKTPTASDIQMTPLQQYMETGQLSPAMMEAAQAGPSAFSTENLSSVPMSTMQQVLGKENEIASSNGMTPQEQAAIANAESDVNRNTAGQRGAIAQDFAGRGIPASLISAALQSQQAGQDASTAHLDALNARANAANTGQQALANEGNMASTMFSQNAGQANTVASASDALAKFNAANTQQANVANQGTEQAANVYNTTNKQNVANTNTSTANDTQKYNQTVAPVTAAQLALQKAGGAASIGEASSQAYTAAGQQAAGLFGGVLGAGATLGAGAMAPAPIVLAAGAMAPAPIVLAEGGEIPPANIPATNFRSGGPVPGEARAPGNDPRNDTVPARLSPGEFVVPRTAMQRPEVRNFLAANVPTPRPPAGAHPTDIASILKAMSMLRGQEA